jgi:hypothetical protein
VKGHPTAEYGKRDTGGISAKNIHQGKILRNFAITIPAPGLQNQTHRRLM